MDASSKLAVIAFGGNALFRPTDHGTHEEQVSRAAEVVSVLLSLTREGWKLLIVHGNAPQIGDLLLQAEQASTKVPPQPLDVAVAQTGGAIGYILQKAWRSALEAEGLRPLVATILTEVEVDPDDPALQQPTKAVGPWLTAYRAEILKREFGWNLQEEPGRGWRKLVPSPRPLAIVNHKAIELLLSGMTVVIAGGGGGIPVVRNYPNGWLGVEAVIDKDYTSSLLASEFNAHTYILVTNVPHVSLNFGTDQERKLDMIDPEEAARLMAAGHFGAGTMQPKVEAALTFARHTGRTAIITDFQNLSEAMSGSAGTHVGAGIPPLPR